MSFLLNEGRIYLSGTSDEVITEETVKKVYDIYVHVCNFRKCCHKVVVLRRNLVLILKN